VHVVVRSYIDFGLRILCKMAPATIKSMEPIGDEVVKVVINQKGYPQPGFDHHAGSYIWLAISGQRKADGSKIIPNAPVMGGPPLPSWLLFHPLTVSSYDEASHDLTLFIKSMGKDEWSGHVLACAHDIRAGKLTLEEVTCYVGGPNGALMFEHVEDYDHVVLVAG
jgi:hypothetical protein